MKKSKEWLLAQILTIGSSAAGTIAGQCPYKGQTPTDHYDVMILARQNILAEKAITDDMRRGIFTEPLHREILSEELGKKIIDHDQNEFIYNPAYPWAHALPDGWVVEGGTEDESNLIPVQLKCPRIRSWHEIRLKGIHGHWLLGSQHSLAVLQKSHEIFSVLNVETMRVIQFPVYRDEELIKSLMAIESKFWDDLNAHIRPESVLAQIDLPPITGELVEINSEEAMRAASSYIAAKEYRDEAEILMEDAKAKIQKLMGPAHVADLPGLRCYQTVQAGRKMIDKAALVKAGIEVESFERTGNPFTVFKAYPRT
jgi:YqaJ-like viral recombinase domain